MAESRKRAEWRVLPLRDYDIYTMHSLEDAICDLVSTGKSPPTIIFSTIDPPAVSVSRAQDLHADVNVELCNHVGVNIARRKTGGRSVYLDRNYFIVSMIGKPADMQAYMRDVAQAYRYFCNRVKGTLRRVLDADVSIENMNDIMVNSVKIGGAAQRQHGTGHGDAVIVHGYLRYEKSWELPLQYLKIDGHSLAPYLAHMNLFTTSVKEHSAVGYHEFYDAFKEMLLRGFHHRVGELTNEERALAIGYRNTGMDISWITGEGEKCMSRGNCDFETVRLKGIKIPQVDNRKQ